MIYRPLIDSDIPKIDKIYREHHQDSFGIPSLLHSIMAGVITENDKVIAFGMLRLIPEAIMVLDLSQSTRIKTVAVNQLLLNSEFGVANNQLGELHAFVQDPRFANLLIKRFGFTDVIGQALVKKVGANG